MEIATDRLVLRTWRGEAYTAPDNVRSQAVMDRLELQRDPTRDFSMPYGPGIWNGLTWVARPR